MRAIILAAGRGKRMGNVTSKLPKCRTVLHNKELIQWQIEALMGAGIEKISVVRGYLSRTFDLGLQYFENHRWADTNMVTSLMTAEKWLSLSNCIISYSDIVYSVQTARILLNSPGEIVITYDPKWEDLWSQRFENPLLDAETFSIKDGRVLEIGGCPTSIGEIEGQYMGLLKFTVQGWKSVKKYLRKYSQSELDKLEMTTLLQGLIQSGIDVSAVPIEDGWYEVDSESDLSLYSEMPPVSQGYFPGY